MTYACILGAGEWRPRDIRHNDAWPLDFAGPAGARPREVFTHVTTRDGDPCAAIVRRHLAAEGDDPFVGTQQRRVAEAATSVAAAQAHAARAALADAGLEPRDIDVVLSVGYLPDRPAIPCAPRVMKELGIRAAVGHDVDDAYASALGQLALARSLVQAGHARHVLLTQSHLLTCAVPLTHRASPNFGDLASALVVGPGQEPGVLALHARTHAEFADAMLWTREPAGEARPWWQAGGDFTLGTLDASGIQQVISGTVKMARDVLLGLCREAGVAPASVRALCSVQPRGWLPAAIAEAAGFRAEAACDTFAELAHVGACGVVANLLQARRTQQLQRGDVVALYAQGAGLTCCAALVRWTA
jgi:3-oxoacyl-[acyl-carrier-protein] synthase-3